MNLPTMDHETYRSEGYVMVPDVLDGELVAALLERIERLLDADSGGAAGSGQRPVYHTEAAVVDDPALRTAELNAPRVIPAIVRHDDLFRETAKSPQVLSMARGLLGTGVNLVSSQALLKPPRHGSAKPLHQDQEYFRVEPEDAVVTCWIALDDATEASGCMWYTPGSHKLGLIEHKPIEGQSTHRVPDDQRLRGMEAVCVPIPAGSCICHHGLTLHRSGPNHTDGWRRALALHYMAADARCMNADVSPDLYMQIDG
jgi:phytanoyl-CoA hydroxylase